MVDAINTTRAAPGERVFAGRQRGVAIVALAAVTLQFVAGIGFALVHGLDVGATTDVTTLAERGAGTADAFRWALLIDMLAYLAVAPVVLHLHGRLRRAADASEGRTWLISVATFAGVAYSLVGAIGGAFAASFGPPLIELARAGGPAAESARVTFTALTSAVYVGLWGPLEWLLVGIWLGVVGWFVRNATSAGHSRSLGSRFRVAALAGRAALVGTRRLIRRAVRSCRTPDRPLPANGVRLAACTFGIMPPAITPSVACWAASSSSRLRRVPDPARMCAT